MKRSRAKAPDYLQPETRSWFDQVVKEFTLEEHHVKLLTLACEAWDQSRLARAGLDEHGLVYEAPTGAIRPRPEVKIEADNRIIFARIVRELDLDFEGGSKSFPSLPSNRE